MPPRSSARHSDTHTDNTSPHIIAAESPSTSSDVSHVVAKKEADDIIHTRWSRDEMVCLLKSVLNHCQTNERGIPSSTKPTASSRTGDKVAIPVGWTDIAVSVPHHSANQCFRKYDNIKHITKKLFETVAEHKATIIGDLVQLLVNNGVITAVTDEKIAAYCADFSRYYTIKTDVPFGLAFQPETSNLVEPTRLMDEVLMKTFPQASDNWFYLKTLQPLLVQINDASSKIVKHKRKQKPFVLDREQRTGLDRLTEEEKELGNTTSTDSSSTSTQRSHGRRRARVIDHDNELTNAVKKISTAAEQLSTTFYSVFTKPAHEKFPSLDSLLTTVMASTSDRLALNSIGVQSTIDLELQSAETIRSVLSDATYQRLRIVLANTSLTL